MRGDLCAQPVVQALQRVTAQLDKIYEEQTRNAFASAPTSWPEVCNRVIDCLWVESMERW